MNPQALKKEKTATRQRQARAQKPAKASAPMGKPQRVSSKEKPVQELREHIVEVISDSGEGAQRCGQSLASIAARMGNGIWTVEIIPAEIQPPARSIAGGSGNRVRLAAGRVTNGGDEADLVVAFNEQVLLGRVHAHELKPGCTILIENKWRNDDDAEIVAAYTRTIGQLEESGYVIQEIPMESECLKYVADPRRGKNMFVLGMLCSIYSLDMQVAREQVAFIFAKKDQNIIDNNIQLLEAGHDWAEANLTFKYRIPPSPLNEAQIVVNGNVSLGLGIMASGMEVCAMYPITPATSVSHYLSEVFETVGGVVHQAEDEIAACAFAIGASYAGKCAVTITSGPGLALKQETIGLAVMTEIPLVVVDVQRGGPSTGLPTKTEQSDLLFSCFGGHGDNPKVVMAVSDIEDCFYSMITARKIAETFNTVVVVLTDASLASAQQPFPRPDISEDWMAPPVDQSEISAGLVPYDWDHRTGLSRRFIPGQPGGMHCLTGLAHDRKSCVAYDSDTNQDGMLHRSLKLAALQKTLKTPPVFGNSEGDLLIVSWGSTKGAVEEAVTLLQEDGHKVSSLHLRFIQPMPSGIKDVLKGFERVMTVEGNWSDNLEHEIIDEENRRYSELAWLLRARFLVDVDCWTEVRGRPIKPGSVVRAASQRLQRKE
ncbi:MAG: 2-oxoacid:acceptor oxidoreductase subunit alpha [Rhodospirillaceae bacterium]|jgi:2-oxoglutarate/2-oxoacid ferredoxin oxidoreductase subunit alpha|nr:2-oxoacid:acceptor oxidoreductase subunit alpha [Rhodospirillaceae bacterium]MBT5245184.1 2-oxoacid:acceptor oxidoreductase subunit alpha [Rhodospirillaceae bacterium]MBT5561910.1 2-oxoacid:acceptor oxidoreductase subunit alpha [Rhodospirillaceae bacterium]MBT6241972.1 2-oxoacid:acceptor oxidoreductase subunit alpha [Rhodospirillaceae bacterium]MBT7138574.1 2-oxoacid:acceptor oxidoreductase subunit alpha [Rhodospirillaceae bacterium]